MPRCSTSKWETQPRRVLTTAVPEGHVSSLAIWNLWLYTEKLGLPRRLAGDSSRLIWSYKARYFFHKKGKGKKKYLQPLHNHIQSVKLILNTSDELQSSYTHRSALQKTAPSQSKNSRALQLSHCAQCHFGLMLLNLVFGKVRHHCWFFCTLKHIKQDRVNMVTACLDPTPFPFLFWACFFDTGSQYIAGLECLILQPASLPFIGMYHYAQHLSCSLLG